MSQDGVIELDELHVVSDLHLGGAPGFQIFNQAPALAWTIDKIGASDKSRRVGLCLNGDIVDFLAEPGASYFSAATAVSILRRIRSDPAFSPVFDALQRFVARPNRLLVLVLGNHDIELSVPAVHESLVVDLTQGNHGARARVHLRLDGVGFRCRIGGREVLCVHGNEVDSFNVIDLGMLHRASRDVTMGRPAPPWVPCAGTRLVIDVMNDVKRRFPWVDLLKPEWELPVALALALDPTKLKHVGGLIPVGLRRVVDGRRRARGLLADEIEEDAEQELDHGPRDDLLVLEDVLSTALDLDAYPRSPGRGRELDPFKELYGDPRPPLEFLAFKAGSDGALLGPGTTAPQLLGPTDWWRRVTRGLTTPEVVRKLLRKWLEEGLKGTFSPWTPDETFEQLDARVDPGIDVLIAGHTHLHRALRRSHGRGWYVNTGTWIRLMEATWLDDEDAFARAWDVLCHGVKPPMGMDALDDPGRFKPEYADIKMIKHVRSVASVSSTPQGTVTRLYVIEEHENADKSKGWREREVASS
ncbi:MAG: metallophosphoesterase [Planctomycetes bacterium]|nr:metallophosphoesterase [Planctomycetota bacterium]